MRTCVPALRGSVPAERGSVILMACPSAVRISCTIMAPSGSPISTVPAMPRLSAQMRRCSGLTHTVTASPTASVSDGARVAISPPIASATWAVLPFNRTSLPGSRFAAPTKVLTNSDWGRS